MSRLPIPHFINQIKTKLGFDRTLTASGEDVVDAVNKQSRQIEELANQATLAKVCNDATAPAGGIPANSYYYHNGVLYYTANVIAQGTTLPQGTAITNGGLNEPRKIESLSVTAKPNFTLIYNMSTKIGNMLIIHAMFNRDVYEDGRDPDVCTIPYTVNEAGMEFLAGKGVSRFATNMSTYGYVNVVNGVTTLVCKNSEIALNNKINFNVVLTIAN